MWPLVFQLFSTDLFSLPGVAVACICLWIGLPRMIEMMELFNVDITTMTNEFRNYVIIVGVVMAAIAVIELVLGFMATGNTRLLIEWSRSNC